MTAKRDLLYLMISPDSAMSVRLRADPRSADSAIAMIPKALFDQQVAMVCDLYDAALTLHRQGVRVESF